MKFQEAKNLKIDDAIFIIGNDNKVYPKKVAGIKLCNEKLVEITQVNCTERDISNGYILPHEAVFLKEKHALQHVVQGMDSQINNMESKALVIRDRIKILEKKELT